MALNRGGCGFAGLGNIFNRLVKQVIAVSGSGTGFGTASPDSSGVFSGNLFFIRWFLALGFDKVN